MYTELLTEFKELKWMFSLITKCSELHSAAHLTSKFKLIQDSNQGFMVILESSWKPNKGYKVLKNPQNNNITIDTGRMTT